MECTIICICHDRLSKGIVCYSMKAICLNIGSPVLTLHVTLEADAVLRVTAGYDSEVQRALQGNRGT
jgi:hypothetical protein